MLIPELKWLLTAEANDQGKIIYSEIITKSDPLFALIYQFLFSFLGRESLPYEILATFLILIQAFIFSKLVRARLLFNEKSYLPGFFYLLFMSLSFDLNKLSPPLIALTFILFALNLLIKQFEKAEFTDSIFEVGLFAGLAFVTHFTSLIFLFWILLSCLVFGKISFRRLLLIILGFFIPLLITMVIMYYKEAFLEFQSLWLLNSKRISLPTFPNLLNIFLIFIIPIIISFLGSIKIFSSNRYSNYQNKAHQILFLYAIFWFLTIFFSSPNSPFYFIYIIPVFAFFTTGYFLHLKKNLIAEISFSIIVLFVIGLFLGFTNLNSLFSTSYLHLKDLRIKMDEVNPALANKSIFVTGNYPSTYVNAHLATSYLEWEYSKDEFKNLDNYESILKLYHKFIKEQPEYIVDKEKVLPNLFKKLPEFAIKYEEMETDLYKRKNIK